MRNRKIRGLYALIVEDKTLMKSLREKASNIVSEEDLKTFLKDEIIPIAKQNNLDFTEEDLLNFEKENIKKLSVDDILNISGGISPKSLLMSGGVLSMVFLGASLAGGSQAHAEVSQSTVTNTMNDITKRIPQEVADGANAHAEGSQPPVVTRPISMFDDDDEYEESTTDEYSDTDEDSYLDEYLDPEESTIDELIVNEGQTPNEINERELSEVTDSTEALLDSVQDVPAEDMDGRLNIQDCEDLNYILKALNLIDPYIYNFTGITENFRLFNGDIGTITLDDNGIRRYINDKGPGSAEFMNILFPSPIGTLNTIANSNTNFTREVRPTAELLADIANYFHYFRVNEDDESALAMLDSFLKFNKDDLRRCAARKILEQDPKDASLELLIPSNKQSSNRDGKYWVRVFRDNMVQAKLKSYDEFNRLFPIEHFVEFDKDSGKCTIRDRAFKILLNLLKNGTHMIQNQEMRKDVDKERVLPKYTTERMLMAYFLLSKDDSDVIPFYNRVAERLRGQLADENKLLEVSSVLRKRVEVLNGMNFILNSPYEHPTQSNGATYQISRVDKDGKVKILKEIFPDCVETAIRHIVNLLCYNRKDGFEKLLKGINEDDLKVKLNSVLTAIKNSDFVEFYPLKERLQMFFLYQRDKGADDVDISTRTLWEYALCNLNEITNLESGKYYKINYSGSKGFEVNSGLINSIKLIYNIAAALELAPPDELKEARECIDRLGNPKNLNEENTKTALYAVLKLLDEGVNFDVGSGFLDFSEGDEVYLHNKSRNAIFIQGSNGNNFSFIIIEGHSATEFNPANIYSEDVIRKNEKWLSKDNLSAIFVNFANRNKKYFHSFPLSTVFDKLYFDSGKRQQFSRKFKENPYLHNHNLLRFLRGAQGEQDNDLQLDRLFTKYPFDIYRLTLKESKENKIEKFQTFIVRTYFSSPAIPAVKNVFRHGFIGDFLSKLDPSQRISLGGVNWYCGVEGDGKLTLYPSDEVPETIDLVIPDFIEINGKRYETKNIVIGSSAFYKCKGLKRFAISGNVDTLTISKLAFVDCEELENFTIPASLQNLTIGYYSFNGCLNLKNFIIPADVQNLTIDHNAFNGCSNLTNFIILGSVQNLTINHNAFYGCLNLTSFTIPADVQNLAINNSAFNGCSRLRDFIIPDSVKNLTIGIYAFYNCKSLQSFKILSNNIQDLTINNYAFYGCLSLRDFIIPDSVENLAIGVIAFYECQSLTNFIIPASVKSLIIGQNAFFCCKNLRDFTIPDSVENLIISDNAFARCSSLRYFIIPANIKSLTIGKNVFYICENLRNFIIPDSVENLTIDDFAFYGCQGLTDFIVPANIKSLTIGKNVFYGCENLRNFIIPDSVENLTIGIYAFYHCKSLQSFKILSNNIQDLTINNYAFYGCLSLRDFIIPDSVENLTIDDFAFYICQGLTNFIVPHNVQNLTIGDQAFKMCKNLKSFTILSNNVQNLIIGGNAFGSCDSLTSFEILSNIVQNLTIGNQAFNMCKNLKIFTIPYNVENLTIGIDAFARSNLEIFTITGRVQHLTIGNNAFYECERLKEFKLPIEVSNLQIGKNAFKGCNSIHIFMPKKMVGNRIDSSFFTNGHILERRSHNE